MANIFSMVSALKEFRSFLLNRYNEPTQASNVILEKSHIALAETLNACLKTAGDCQPDYWKILAQTYQRSMQEVLDKLCENEVLSYVEVIEFIRFQREMTVLRPFLEAITAIKSSQINNKAHLFTRTQQSAPSQTVVNTPRIIDEDALARYRISWPLTFHPSKLDGLGLSHIEPLFKLLLSDHHNLAENYAFLSTLIQSHTGDLKTEYLLEMMNSAACFDGALTNTRATKTLTALFETSFEDDAKEAIARYLTQNDRFAKFITRAMSSVLHDIDHWWNKPSLFWTLFQSLSTANQCQSIITYAQECRRGENALHEMRVFNESLAHILKNFFELKPKLTITDIGLILNNLLQYPKLKNLIDNHFASRLRGIFSIENNSELPALIREITTAQAAEFLYDIIWRNRYVLQDPKTVIAVLSNPYFCLPLLSDEINQKNKSDSSVLNDIIITLLQRTMMSDDVDNSNIPLLDAIMTSCDDKVGKVLITNADIINTIKKNETTFTAYILRNFSTTKSKQWLKEIPITIEQCCKIIMCIDEGSLDKVLLSSALESVQHSLTTLLTKGGVALEKGLENLRALHFSVKNPELHGKLFEATSSLYYAENRVFKLVTNGVRPLTANTPIHSEIYEYVCKHSVLRGYLIKDFLKITADSDEQTLDYCLQLPKSVLSTLCLHAPEISQRLQSSDSRKLRIILVNFDEALSVRLISKLDFDGLLELSKYMHLLTPNTLKQFHDRLMNTTKIYDVNDVHIHSVFIKALSNLTEQVLNRFVEEKEDEHLKLSEKIRIFNRRYPLLTHSRLDVLSILLQSPILSNSPWLSLIAELWVELFIFDLRHTEGLPNEIANSELLQNSQVIRALIWTFCQTDKDQHQKNLLKQLISRHLTVENYSLLLNMSLGLDEWEVLFESILANTKLSMQLISLTLSHSIIQNDEVLAQLCKHAQLQDKILEHLKCQSKGSNVFELTSRVVGCIALHDKSLERLNYLSYSRLMIIHRIARMSEGMPLATILKANNPLIFSEFEALLHWNCQYPLAMFRYLKPKLYTSEILSLLHDLPKLSDELHEELVDELCQKLHTYDILKVHQCITEYCQSKKIDPTTTLDIIGRIIHSLIDSSITKRHHSHNTYTKINSHEYKAFVKARQLPEMKDRLENEPTLPLFFHNKFYYVPNEWLKESRKMLKHLEEVRLQIQKKGQIIEPIEHIEYLQPSLPTRNHF